MAMGFKANTRGLFGNPQPGINPNAGIEPVGHSMPQQQPEQRGGGFFGEGGAGRGIAGTIGDYLLQASGMRPIYAPQMQQNRKMEYDQQQAQRERQQSWEDYTRKYEFERANPKPTSDAFTQTLINAGIDPASVQGKEMYRDRAASMSRDPNDELVTVSIPGIGLYSGPRSGLAEVMGGQRPIKPVGGLTPLQGGTASDGGGTFR